eukprot:37412_1
MKMPIHLPPIRIPNSPRFSLSSLNADSSPLTEREQRTRPPTPIEPPQNGEDFPVESPKNGEDDFPSPSSSEDSLSPPSDKTHSPIDSAHSDSFPLSTPHLTRTFTPQCDTCARVTRDECRPNGDDSVPKFHASHPETPEFTPPSPSPTVFSHMSYAHVHARRETSSSQALSPRSCGAFSPRSQVFGVENESDTQFSPPSDACNSTHSTPLQRPMVFSHVAYARGSQKGSAGTPPLESELSPLFSQQNSIFENCDELFSDSFETSISPDFAPRSGEFAPNSDYSSRFMLKMPIPTPHTPYTSQFTGRIHRPHSTPLTRQQSAPLLRSRAPHVTPHIRPHSTPPTFMPMVTLPPLHQAQVGESPEMFGSRPYRTSHNQSRSSSHISLGSSHLSLLSPSSSSHLSLLSPSSGSTGEYREKGVPDYDQMLASVLGTRPGYDTETDSDSTTFIPLDPHLAPASPISPFTQMKPISPATSPRPKPLAPRMPPVVPGEPIFPPNQKVILFGLNHLSGAAIEALCCKHGPLAAPLEMKYDQYGQFTGMVKVTYQSIQSAQSSYLHFNSCPPNAGISAKFGNPRILNPKCRSHARPRSLPKRPTRSSSERTLQQYYPRALPKFQKLPTASEASARLRARATSVGQPAAVGVTYDGGRFPGGMSTLPKPEIIGNTIVCQSESEIPVELLGDPGVERRVLTVSAKTQVKSIAGAVAHTIRKRQCPVVLAGGAPGVNLGVKAVAIAREYLINDDIELCCYCERSNHIGGFRFSVVAVNNLVHLGDLDDRTMLKVSRHSKANKLAGAITRQARQRRSISLGAMGSGSVLQAVKAIATARDLVASEGIELVIQPEFISLLIGEGGTQNRSVLRIHVHPQVSTRRR